MKQRIFCHEKFKSLMFSATMTITVVFLMTLSDTVVTGRILGEQALIGVNLVSPLVSLTAFICMMIGTGTAYRFSYELGSFRRERAREYAGQGLLLCLALSAGLALLAYAGRDAYLASVSTSGEVLAYTRGYYTYIPALVLTYPFYILFQDLAYADGAGKLCVATSLVQLAVNVAVSVAACLRIGIAGVSLGTVVGNVTAIAMYLTRLASKNTNLRFTPHLSAADVWTVLKYSYVHASLYLYWGVSWMVLNRFFTVKFDERSFPVMTVINGVLYLTLVFDGVGQAAEPILNVYWGEGNPDGVRKVMGAALKTALAEGLAAALLLLVLGGNVSRIYGITTPEIVEMSAVAVRILAPAMPFVSLLYLFTMYYLLTGRFFISFAISFCKDFAFFALLPIAMGLAMDMSGMWSGMTLSFVAVTVGGSLILHSRYGGSFPLLLEEKAVVSKDAWLDQDGVMGLRDWAEEECGRHDIEPRRQMKLMLFIEELGMTIVEKNGSKPPLCELTLFFDDPEALGVIMRDNGVSYDMAEEESPTLRVYLVNSLLANNASNSYLLTHNYNRNIFKIKRDATKRRAKQEAGK